MVHNEEIRGLRLDSNGKLDIPKDKTKLKFDVGLSWRAPNSAIWLYNEDDLFVVGIEPNVRALNVLKGSGHVSTKKVKVKRTENNYMLLECAIDNVLEPTEMDFYSMKGDMGTSSLLEPNQRLLRKQKIGEIYKVKVIPLSYIFDLIPWDRFEYVDLVKTDCQGKDLDVVRSLGNYINKVVYFHCEVTTADHYHGEHKAWEFFETMEYHGFEKIGRKRVDVSFVNKSLKDTKVFHQCLGL